MANGTVTKTNIEDLGKALKEMKAMTDEDAAYLEYLAKQADNEAYADTKGVYEKQLQ